MVVGLGAALVMTSAALGLEPGAPYQVVRVDRGEETIPGWAWSFKPDGRGRVLFTASGPASRRLVEFDPGTGALREVAERSGGLELAGVVHSASGTRAIVVEDAPLLGSRLAAIDVDGGAESFLATLRQVEQGGALGDVWELEGGAVVLWDYSPTGGSAAWWTDGTPAGTRAVQVPPGVRKGWAVAVGEHVLYQQLDGLWSWTPRSGQRRRVHVGVSDQLSVNTLLPDGRVAVVYNGGLIVTDGTPEGTSLLDRDPWLPSGWWHGLACAGERLIAYDREWIASYDLASGAQFEMFRLAAEPNTSRSVQAAAGGLVVVDATWFGGPVRGHWTDGTAAGTRLILEGTPGYQAVLSGDGGPAAFLQMDDGAAGLAFRLDREGARAVTPWGGWSTLEFGATTVINGLAYSCLPDGNPWVIGGGADRPLMDLSRREPVGLGAWAWEGGSERAWFVDTRDGGGAMWSTSGEPGDLVPSPCSLCGPSFSWVWGGDGAGGGPFALVDGMGRKHLLRARAGLEPELLAEWTPTCPYGAYTLAAGGGGWAAASACDVVLTTGAADRPLQWALPGGWSSAWGIWSRWLGHGFAIWSPAGPSADQGWRFWFADERGVRELGVVGGSMWPFVMGGRVCVPRLSVSTLNYELWSSDGSAPMAVTARSDLEFPGFVGERGGVAYFFGPSSDGHAFSLFAGPAEDVALSGLRERARLEAQPRALHFVGDRILAELGAGEGRILSIDPGAGLVEVLFAGPSSVRGKASSGDRLAAVGTYSSSGEPELWFTDGTRAGSRRAPRSGVPSAPPSGGTFVGGRFVYVEDAEGQGPQLFAMNLCAADLTGDGFLDFFDYGAFFEAFEESRPNADLNGDGFVDPLDVADFAAAFETGC